MGKEFKTKTVKDHYNRDIEVPIVPNLHQKVYRAAKKKGALEMADWHWCETTHCRAGWVVHLAGQQGYDLERRVTASLAAQMIYEASTGKPVHENAFYVGNSEALRSMRNAAETERKQNAAKARTQKRPVAVRKKNVHKLAKVALAVMDSKVAVPTA
jgi:hypothetical protein